MIRPVPPWEPDRETLVRALIRAAAHPGEGLRFLDRQERPTFLEWSAILQRARGAASRITAAGLEPGQRVAIVYPTGPAFFDAFFGALLAGGVPVPLYPPVRLGRMDEYRDRTAGMIQAAKARLILTDALVRRVFGETAERAAAPLGCHLLEDLPAGPPAEADPAPGDLAMIQFSSGTTVDPKPVALSHRAVMAQTWALETFFPDTEAQTQAGVSWLPLYHDMGLIGCVFPALRRPGTLTLIGPELFVARPAVWLRAISRWGGTVSPAPNFAYALCVDRIQDEELEGVDLSGWRLALNGAEPVAPEVLRTFTRRFARWGLRESALTPVYGLSEAALAVTFSAPDQPFFAARFERVALAEGRVQAAEDGVELVSVGRPIPGFEVRIEAPPGLDVGAVMARGPSLMEGYLDRPEATAAALREGWLDTGDEGFLHEGQLFITGRRKDVLVLNGRKYPPHAVEQAMDSVEGVRTGCAAAVTWLEEGAQGERLLIFVERQKGATVDPAACAEAALRQTGLPVDQVLVLEPGTLPRTSSGKIRRGEALSRFRAGALSAPDAVGLVSMAGLMARSAVAFWRAKP